MKPSSKKSLVIRKSNSLIEARYSLSLAEQRFILLLASAISPDDEDFKKYEIKVADFAKMFGLENCKSIYADVQKAAKELVGKRLDLSKDGEEIYTTWLSYVKYIDGSGVINSEFHSSLKPYLLQLKSHFTQYDFFQVIDFKSQYSMRLYELLKMEAYKAKNGQFKRLFEVDELRLLLGVDKDNYALFADLKKWTIQPAIKEISAKTDLTITDVNYGKTGRKITNVTFMVSIKPKAVISENLETAPNTAPIIERLVMLGFSLETATVYQKKYGIERIERNIAYTLENQKNGSVNNLPSYLNNAIVNDYAAAAEIKKTSDQEQVKQKEKIARDEKIKAKEKEQAAKVKYDKAFEVYHALPEEQRAEILQEFMDTTDAYTLGQLKKLQNTGQDIFRRGMVSSIFNCFLIKKGF
jgi:plasmid replication initiation protein